jgi:hypothetical protein
MNTQYSQLNNPRIVNTEMKGESSKNLIQVQNAINPQPNPEPAAIQQQYIPKKGKQILIK